MHVHAQPTEMEFPDIAAPNGKVFFRNATDGKLYVCSASAVNSHSRRLIATAGHCVHDGKDGTWHENWFFYPNYYYGESADH